MGNIPEVVPFLAVAGDYGDIVHGVLLEPQNWSGQYVDAVSQSMSFEEMTATYQHGKLSFRGKLSLKVLDCD
jgi:hypothetical protein